MRTFDRVLALTLALPFAPPIAGASEPDARVSFNRDIRPILSDRCFKCHGPDAAARQSGLRLDERRDALADRGGYAAVVPGDDAASELISRVTSSNPKHRMPPPDSNKRLSTSEIELLRTWIREGAHYERHWAFEPLVKPAPPGFVRAADPVEAFVAAKLHERGLRLAPAATPETLLRRVTLDLTGLPPTLPELKSFRAALNARGADLDACYEREVDRLLHSPHFGEHLAVAWLDAARYADTNGYFGDKPRQMWLWRDWVIHALNGNMPFDQFTIEQLAGDLLPDSSVQQRIATGFNRNHMANNETGIIDEEFRVEYVVDRVHTTMTAWLGLSAGCAQCHDHKFDPISQREFYQLFSFFNNVPESGLIHADNPPPKIEVPSNELEQELVQLAEGSRAAMEAFEPHKKLLSDAIAEWEAGAPNTLPVAPDQSLVFLESFEGSLRPGVTSHGTTLVFETGARGQAGKFDATQHVEAHPHGFDPDGPWSIGFWLNPDGTLSCPLSLIEPTGERRGIEVIFGKGLLTVHLVHRWGVSLIEVSTREPLSSKVWHHVVISYDGKRAANGVRVYVDGVPATVEVHRDNLTETIANGEPLRIGRRDSGLGFYGLLDEVRIVQRALNDEAVSEWYWGERIRGILAVAAADRSTRDSDMLLDYYVERFADPDVHTIRQRVHAARKAEQRARASVPTALVMQEMEKPRATHVLERGEYDKPGDIVQPGVPHALAPWPVGEPHNRLGLARWLVSADNPLTPRVAVNRLWQHCFGEGLVRTVDDFGSQGEPPTHPELLDWLAATFRESGWDVKRLLKVIVTSNVYKQSSQFAGTGSQFDPENRLLARGPSARLSAEMLRDQALAVSGLLVRRIGGPSVKPYQPPGLWESVSYDGEESYEADQGDGLWRRSVYTYVKRQAPPPAMLIFDGPTREKCTMRRAATNTPLQALLLLNDDTYVEAARLLAAKTMLAASTDRARLEYLWTTVLLRNAQPDELELLDGLLKRQRSRLAAEPEQAHQLLSIGATKVDEPCDPSELAAWTVVAQAVLNVDEAISKR